MGQVKVPSMIGSKVIALRAPTEKEIEEIGIESYGHEQPCIVEFDNGIKMLALRDAEGNGYGQMIGLYKKTQFYVSPES